MIYQSTIENIFAYACSRETLIGRGPSLTPEEEESTRKAREEKDKSYEKAKIVAWSVWYEGYVRGDIDFRGLLEQARHSLVALGVDDFDRTKTLGLLADKALSVSPPKSKPGKAGFIDPRKSIAIQLVNLANDDGYVLSRESKLGKTAFDHVADLMTNLGMDTTARQVHDWCYPRKKKIPQ